MKDGDGLVYNGDLYIRRSSTEAAIKDKRPGKGMWRRATRIPVAVRRMLWPERAKIIPTKGGGTQRDTPSRTCDIGGRVESQPERRALHPIKQEE